MKKIILVMLIILTIVFGSCARAPEKSAQDNATNKNENLAVDFKLQNLKGENITLSDYKGKVVVMNFFATWCPPCKAELPGFMNTKEKYKDKNIVFLFIDIQESADTVKSFVEDRGYADMNPLLDADGRISNKYSIRGIPRTYILDKEGNIVFSNEGYLDETALKAAIDSALSDQQK